MDHSILRAFNLTCKITSGQITLAADRLILPEVQTVFLSISCDCAEEYFMKNLELRSSLIKSGIFLVLCVFFIYAFAVSDSGGITGTISSLFSGAVFLVGLALALAVSVALMIGLYFGILSLYNKKVCKKTYDEFKTTLSESSGPLADSFALTCYGAHARSKRISEEDIAPLRDQQEVMSNQLSAIKQSVDSLEQSIVTLSSSATAIAGEINTLATKTKTVEEDLEGKASTASIDESMEKLAGELSSIQNSVKPLTEKLSELENAISSMTDEDEEEGIDLQELINKAVSGLQEELAAVKASVMTLSTASEEEEVEPEETIHRILTYFANKKDEKQFTALVHKAVAKKMTYAQIGEFLNDSLSAKNAEIIADHPSLTKDFIRTCRQKA